MHPPSPIAMAPTRPAILAQPREVIEIDSDNDSDDEVVEIPRPRPVRPVAHMPPQPLQPAFRERSALADEFMALFAEAEAEQDAQRCAEGTQHRIPIAPEPEVARSITVDECLAKVLEIYPDISHDHVRNMLRDGLEVGIQLDTTWCEQLIMRILDEGQYPTEREAKRAALKRKREPSENDFDRSPMRNGTSAVRRAYQSVATTVLQNEYPEIPVKFIDQTLREKASLFKAFLALEEAERTSSAMDASRRPYRKVRRRDPKPLPIIHEDTHSEAMESVQKELFAAQKKVAGDTARRQREEQKRLEEEQNNAIALSNNEMVECPCCCDKFAANRMAFCNGEKVHFYCYECARRWVNEQMVQGKCYPKCFATVDCGAEISQAQLKAFLKPEEYKRLEMLQQWDAVNMAGIENFVRCPFCDFGAECVPVETDREFRCQNPNCRIVSCRLCEKETHTPKTCAEAEKDRKGSVRHRIEEAMTDALLRTCNKCKIKFLKLDGCNKMTCPKCGNAQCYVCGNNVNSYNHFHQSAGKCPLYDNNTEKRHQDEVKAAEAAVLEVVRQQNPDMTEEELRIHFSDNVQQEEQKRVAAGERHRPGGPPPPAPQPHPFAAPPFLPQDLHGFNPHHGLGIDPQNGLNHIAGPYWVDMPRRQYQGQAAAYIPGVRPPAPPMGQPWAPYQHPGEFQLHQQRQHQHLQRLQQRQQQHTEQIQQHQQQLQQQVHQRQQMLQNLQRYQDQHQTHGHRHR